MIQPKGANIIKVSTTPKRGSKQNHITHNVNSWPCKCSIKTVVNLVDNNSVVRDLILVDSILSSSLTLEADNKEVKVVVNG